MILEGRHIDLRWFQMAHWSRGQKYENFNKYCQYVSHSIKITFSCISKSIYQQNSTYRNSCDIDQSTDSGVRPAVSSLVLPLASGVALSMSFSMSCLYFLICKVVIITTCISSNCYEVAHVSQFLQSSQRMPIASIE